MILCNLEIHRALDAGRLKISPEPTPRFSTLENPHCPYDTHSVDLKLDKEIVVPRTGQFSIDLTAPGSIAQTIYDHSDRRLIDRSQPYKLEPMKFVLGRTVEFIELPIPTSRPKQSGKTNANQVCLAARIEGKSSRARFGLIVHCTAPTVHPGFCGTLTLEITNLGPAPILLAPSMYIAQLIIEEVRGIPAQNPSQFQGQRNPAGLTEKTNK